MRQLRLALVPCLWILTGCAVGVPHPPLALVSPRPAHLIDQNDRITNEGVVWVRDLTTTWVINCAVLSTLRKENVNQCYAPFAMPK